MDVYLDFETFFDKDYSLKKMSIEEYVRDARFEPHMMCVAVDDGAVRHVPAGLIPRVLDALRLDCPTTRVFMHNGKFDGFILAQRYGIQIANPLCTRCMGRVAGVSRICRESLAAQSEFFGAGVKGDFLLNAQGKHLSDFTPVEMDAYIGYCMQDVELLRNNAKRMLPYVDDLALRFISMSLKMYLYPVFEIDTFLLANYLRKLERDHAEAMQRLSSLFHFADTGAFLKALRSKAKFCEMLERVGGVVPYKLSEKKTATAKRKAEAEGKDTAGIEVYEPALAKNDIAFMELMHSDNPNVAALANARAENNSSMAVSRCRTYLDKGARGPMPVALEAYLAHTGRYSAGTSEGVKSDQSNVQNLAKRGNDKTLRQAIKVPRGMRLVACDSSQIEARVLAWLAGERWLLKSFAEKEDPYSQMAADIYGETYETIKEWTKGKSAHDPDADPSLKKKFKQYRNIGKTAVLQLGYYAGAAKLSTYLKQQGIRLSEDDAEHDREAQRIVQVYRYRNVAIRTFWKKCEQVINMMLSGLSGTFGGPRGDTLRYDGAYDLFGHKVAMVALPDGYKLFYPNLRMELVDGRPEVVYDLMEKGRVNTKRLHPGILCNNVTQGLAFSIIRLQALAIDTRYSIRINIHDSLGVVVPEEDAEECKLFMLKVMQTSPSWAKGLCLGAEAEIGTDFTVA